MKSLRGMNKVLGTALLWGLFSLGSCADDTVYVSVNVRNIPAGTARLLTKPSVDSVSYGQEIFERTTSDDPMVIGFRLPAGTQGQFKIYVEPQSGSGAPMMQCDLPVNGTSDPLPLFTARGNSVDANLSIHPDPSGITSPIFSAFTLPNNQVFTAGQNGQVGIWNGCYWKSPPGATTKTLSGVWGSSPSDVWLVGGNTQTDTTVTIIHWDGKILTESSPLSPYIPGRLFSVWGSSPTEVWAVGQEVGPKGPQGLILKLNGSRWQKYADTEFDSTAEDTVLWNRIVGLDSSHIYLVGNANSCNGTPARCRGNIALYSADGGPLKWRRPRSLAASALYGLVPMNPTTIWLSGGSGYVATWNGKIAMSGADYVIADSDFTTVTGTPSLFPSGLFGVPSDPATVYFTVFMNGMPSTAYKTQGGRAVPMTFPADPDNAFDRQITVITGLGPSDFWYLGYDGHRFHYDGKALKKYAQPN